MLAVLGPILGPILSPLGSAKVAGGGAPAPHRYWRIAIKAPNGSPPRVAVSETVLLVSGAPIAGMGAAVITGSHFESIEHSAGGYAGLKDGAASTYMQFQAYADNSPIRIDIDLGAAGASTADGVRLGSALAVPPAAYELFYSDDKATYTSVKAGPCGAWAQNTIKDF